MVQLKDITVKLKAWVEIHFNSAMVQLKGGAQNTVVGFQGNFNSAMVQLKEIMGGHIYYMIHQFQFRYGTIKSVPAIACEDSKSNFNSAMVQLKV